MSCLCQLFPSQYHLKILHSVAFSTAAAEPVFSLVYEHSTSIPTSGRDYTSFPTPLCWCVSHPPHYPQPPSRSPCWLLHLHGITLGKNKAALPTTTKRRSWNYTYYNLQRTIQQQEQKMHCIYLGYHYLNFLLPK